MEKIPTNSGDKKDNNEKRFKEALNDFLAGDIERTAQYLKENPEQISKFCHRAAYGYMGVIEAGLQGLMIFADHLAPSDNENLPEDIKDSVDKLIRTDVEGVLEYYDGNVEVVIKKYSDLITYFLRML